jgi:putative transposase
MSDVLQHGHGFRTFNVVDDVNREVFSIDLNPGIKADRVTRYLDQIAAWRSYPKWIYGDHGPEFTASELATWVAHHQVMLDFIKLDRAYQNRFVECFNRTYWEGVLALYWFSNLAEVKHMMDDRIQLYLHERPHDGRTDMTLIESLNMA